MDRRRFYGLAALILLLAFALRLGGAIGWQRFTSVRGGSPFFFGDSDSYWQLAGALASGTPYEHDPVRHWKLFRMPGYPLVLAPLFLMTDDPPVFAARVENVVLGCLTVLLTGAVALAMFGDRRPALWAMLFVAVMPELLFQSVCVLSEELSCVMNLALTLALIALARSRFSPARAVWGGLFWALGVYVRPDALCLFPFVVCVLFLFRDTRVFVSRYACRAVLCGAILLSVFIGLMSPWWVRNARLTGRFIPTTLQVGASLYDGLSPTASGGSDMVFVDRFRDELDRTEATEPGGNKEFYEVRLDRAMKEAALDWARKHPKEAIRLAGVKFFRLWNVFPNEPAFSAVPARLLICLTFLPVSLGAFWGAWRLRRVQLVRLLWIPALYITLLHLIFVSSLRYRAPIL
ncbi:MAG: hypothetical protein IKT12_03615, partial [Thermoguttaceae bacterium]|nr:hypothetical protein [Thermoguttaceae bacterium]